MTYFNYHAQVKKLIADNKLIGWFYTDEYNKISPALVLVFADLKHPFMPIRKHHWKEYELLLSDKINKLDIKE